MRKHHGQKHHLFIGILFLLMATFAVAATIPPATKKSTTKSATPSLTPAGNALLSKYANMLKAAQAELGKILPKIDEAKKSAFIKAHEAETAAAKALADAKHASLDSDGKDKAALRKTLDAAKEAQARITKNAAVPVNATLAEL